MLLGIIKIETLVTSISPKTIVLGKTIEIGLVGLVQMILIVAVALISAKTFLDSELLNSFNVRDLAILELLISTGMRVGELTRLNISDMNFQERSCIVLGKAMATMAIDKGMPIEQVQKLLGHIKIDTTMEYAMVNQNNVKNSHRKYIT